MRLPIWVVLALSLSACGTADPPLHHPQAPGEHDHLAPHGGILVELGEEFAHVELLLERDEGALTAWLLDGDAERAVRSAAPDLQVVLVQADAQLILNLAPVASALTGETAGDTSQFHVVDPRLETWSGVEGRLPRIELLGSVFEGVVFAGGHEHE